MQLVWSCPQDDRRPGQCHSQPPAPKAASRLMLEDKSNRWDCLLHPCSIATSAFWMCHLTSAARAMLAAQVGIAGRTGCGKSTLMMSLFRVMEAASGSITIDGVNIREIGLFDLRSRLALVPQARTLCTCDCLVSLRDVCRPASCVCNLHCHGQSLSRSCRTICCRPHMPDHAARAVNVAACGAFPAPF